MRGIPNNPVPCEVCGRPGFNCKIGARCNRHRPPSAKLKYPFDEAKDAIIRSAWLSAGNKRKLGAAITDATRRIGYPRHIVRNRAQRLGVTYDTRHKWTAEEERFLINNCGSMPIKALQKKLGHAYVAVVSKISAMKLRYVVKEGLTGDEVAAGLGVSARTFRKWEQEGVIKRFAGRFPENRVLDFIRKYPDYYDLRRVNQEWYKAMLFPNAPCFTADHLETRSQLDGYRICEELA